MPAIVIGLIISISVWSCQTDESNDPKPKVSFNYNTLKINGKSSGFNYKGVPVVPEIKVSFTTPVRQSSVNGSVLLSDKNSVSVPVTITFENQDSTLVIKPTSPLKFLSRYSFSVSGGLKSKSGSSFPSSLNVELLTAIDSTDKFAPIPADSLLTLVQKQTFKYFWEFGHSVSGMARERNSSGDVVTSGGTGFGLMAIPVAINRKFITKSEGLKRVQKTVDFLKNKAQRYHGAYPHWLNGATGITVPFSANDDGADLVETSYLMMGLLTVRQ
jgi:hypothetical protein